MRRHNIFLIGPMGSGKTTIGRQLARRLNLEFYDSDRVIEERTGVSIPTIFDLEGESGFRQREREVIDQLTQMDHIVLATGGGAVLNEENQRHLRERGTVIYLSASTEELFARTSKDKNRPLLQTENPRARIEQLLTERHPIYQELADYVINTGQSGLKTVIRDILRLVEKSSETAEGAGQRD